MNEIEQAKLIEENERLKLRCESLDNYFWNKTKEANVWKSLLAEIGNLLSQDKEQNYVDLVNKIDNALDSFEFKGIQAEIMKHDNPYQSLLKEIEAVKRREAALRVTVSKLMPDFCPVCQGGQMQSNGCSKCNWLIGEL